MGCLHNSQLLASLSQRATQIIIVAFDSLLIDEVCKRLHDMTEQVAGARCLCASFEPPVASSIYLPVMGAPESLLQ